MINILSFDGQQLLLIDFTSLGDALQLRCTCRALNSVMFEKRKTYDVAIKFATTMTTAAITELPNPSTYDDAGYPPFLPSFSPYSVLQFCPNARIPEHLYPLCVYRGWEGKEVEG